MCVNGCALDRPGIGSDGEVLGTRVDHYIGPAKSASCPVDKSDFQSSRSYETP